jgi:hypothetical protein
MVRFRVSQIEQCRKGAAVAVALDDALFLR